MDAGKLWGKVSQQFNTYKKDIWYGAADNIKTVWPEFLTYIKSNFPNAEGLKSLDFGCGTGMFCKELKALGFNASGMDISEEMIKIGNANLPANIKLYVGDSLAAKELSKTDGQFNLVSAIMVLQFLEEDKIANLADSLAIDGHIIFVNHNPEHLKLRNVIDMMPLGDTGVSIPIYPRTAKEYDAIFSGLGFKKTLEAYRESSEAILKQYNITQTKDMRKYIILAYQKI